MSEKRNVLIFSGATYPAMQVIDCLKNSPRFHVIAAASYPNHSEYVCNDTISDLPFVTAPEFMSAFVDLIVRRKVEFVIPTDDTIAMILKEHEKEIPAVIVCSPYETTKLCRYKSLTYQKLAGEPFVPLTYGRDSIEEIENYPLFVKPDNSQGSKGAKLISSKHELQQIENIDEMVICEYLPGEEYTVDCFTNKEGELIFCNPRIRTRLMNGITARGNNIPCSEEFKHIMRVINKKIEFRGYWYVQLKRDVKGKLKLLEICTRFAGTFGISKALGVNLPLLSLCDFAGLEANAIVNDYTVVCDKTYIDRYSLSVKYSKVYVDYDDTITYKHGEGVNPYVIAYLYQCKQKGIKIVLVTRHQDTFKESLQDSFKRLNICETLFDEIVELSWDQNKDDFINGVERAIFLDNSFAERKKVYDRHKIPVFDVPNVDCLFDWRE